MQSRVVCVVISLLLFILSNASAATFVDITSYGSASSGATLQMAINDISSKYNDGGSVEIVYPYKTKITVPDTIYLKSNISVNFNGSTLVWTGSYGGSVISNDINYVLYNAGLYDGQIDPGNAKIIFDLNSPQFCNLKNLIVINPVSVAVNSNLTVVSIKADPVNMVNNIKYKNKNALSNIFDNISSDFYVPVHTGMLFEGTYNNDGSTPSNINTAVVTLNQFSNIHFPVIKGIAYNFVKWVDNNYFTGVQRHNLTADYAKGVVFNTSQPDTHIGVYSNHFEHLACDIFGNYTNRNCVVFNMTKTNIIHDLFWSNSSWTLETLILDNFKNPPASNYTSYMVTISGYNDENGMTTVTKGMKAAPGGLVWLNENRIVPTNLLGSGVANSSTFLSGDGTWQSITGTNALQLRGKNVSEASPEEANCLMWRQNQWVPDSCSATGTGIVTNPLNASSDKRIARFNGATGNKINDSLVEISDTGDITKKSNSTFVIGGDLSSNATGMQLGRPISIASNDKALLQTQTTIQPTSDITGATYGMSLVPTIATSSKNIAYMRPFYLRADTLSDYSGNITNLQSMVIDNPVKSGGSITNLYGLYINNLTSGSNSNWSIVTGTAPNLFGGSTIVGQLADLTVTSKDGYLYIPTVIGRPTVTPTLYPGKSPIVHNKATNAEELCVFSMTANKWKCLALPN